MKVPIAALAALLLVATCSLAEPHFGDSSVAASPEKPDIVPITCCFSYLQHPIPRSLIASAYTTSSRCTQPAVILVTKKRRKLCTDPQAAWVQAHLEHFQTLEY